MAEPEDSRPTIIQDGTFSLPEGLSYGPVQPTATVRLSAQLHQGPLPPPEQLAAYAKIDPEAVQWIFRQAAASAEHTTVAAVLVAYLKGPEAVDPGTDRSTDPDAATTSSP